MFFFFIISLQFTRRLIEGFHHVLIFLQDIMYRLWRITLICNYVIMTSILQEYRIFRKSIDNMYKKIYTEILPSVVFISKH